MQKLMKAIHKNQKGFTLVELMVVVVIIGVLVAIAIPIYGTVTRNAEDRAHEANIRTIKGAVQMYAIESSPPATNISSGTLVDIYPTLDNYLEAGLKPPRGNDPYQFYMASGEVFVSPTVPLP